MIIYLLNLFQNPLLKDYLFPPHSFCPNGQLSHMSNHYPKCDPCGTHLLVKPKSKAAGGNDTFTQVEHFSNGAEKVKLIAT